MNERNPAHPMWMALRYACAIVCGVLAGVGIPDSMQVGARLMFPGEAEWSPTFWGEHWVVRPVMTAIATAGAGFVAGSVARRSGSIIAVISALPAFLLWLFVAVSSWREFTLFWEVEIYVSIGNKLAGTAISLIILPIAWAAGGAGEAFGREHAQHFDSRRWSLLGVKWYHIFWVPFIIHLVLIQTAAVGLWGFDWLVVAWRSGAGMGSLLPTAFAGLLIGTLALTYTGVHRAYGILAGVGPEAALEASSPARQVLTYGVGFPVGALALQLIIALIHYGLARLFA